MADSAFEQDIFVNAPPEIVRAFLANMQDHPKIHPLIVAITPLDPTTDADSGFCPSQLNKGRQYAFFGEKGCGWYEASGH